MERPLRLIATNPVDALARTIEALLVVASQPLPVADLCAAAEAEADQVEEALELLASRFAEGRSGIVLENVAGGWAFRAAASETEACARLFEKPVERGLVTEGGRENEFGAIRYRTTPLFERVFGLESLAALPRLDDLGADVTEIRERLEAVAAKRPA